MKEEKVLADERMAFLEDNLKKSFAERPDIAKNLKDYLNHMLLKSYKLMDETNEQNEWLRCQGKNGLIKKLKKFVDKY